MDSFSSGCTSIISKCKSSFFDNIQEHIYRATSARTMTHIHFPIALMGSECASFEGTRSDENLRSPIGSRTFSALPLRLFVRSLGQTFSIRASFSPPALSSFLPPARGDFIFSFIVSDVIFYVCHQLNIQIRCQRSIHQTNLSICELMVPRISDLL